MAILFFNPTLRVRTLQWFLLSLFYPILWAAVQLLGGEKSTPFAGGHPANRISFITLGVAAFLIPHHVGSLFLTDAPVVIIDWLLVAAETAGVGYLLVKFWPPATILTFIFLVGLLVFRTVAIVASKKPIWRQRFHILGGCSQSRIQDSPWTTFVNGPRARPLVRGESIFIIIVRSVILVAVTLGLPLFAYVFIMLRPSQSNIVTQAIAPQFARSGVSRNPDLSGLLELDPLQRAVLLMPDGITATVSVSGSSNAEPQPCSLFSQKGSLTAAPDVFDELFSTILVAECPLSWPNITTMHFSATFNGSIPFLQIFPGQGRFDDLLAFTEGIPVPPNENMFASMSWTSRRIIPAPSGSSYIQTIFASFPPQRLVQHMRTSSLFALQGGAAATTSNTTSTSTVTLVQTQTHPTQFFEDQVTDSALDGLSALGGFWTFVDGIKIKIKRPQVPSGTAHHRL